jgi:hypothetical protein
MSQRPLQMTKAQARALIIAWERAGYVQSLAAADLGMPRKTYAGHLVHARQLLGETGPMVAPAPVPPGLRSGKTTVQYDADGNVVAEWRRLHPEANALQAFVDELCKQVGGKAPKLPPAQRRGGSRLLLEVPIFDAHFGKYCWGPETGADFDSQVAEAMVVGSVERAVAQAPPCGRALLVIGGDVFHADSRHNTTERGGHVLDVDTRQAKVWEVATRAIHRSIERLATTAAVVEIAVIPGNHDWESSFHLQRLLAAYYRADQRVKVHQQPRSRAYIRHGCVLLGLAHGHLIPMANLPLLMAQEEPKLWFETTEHAWHLGHIHKRKGITSASGDTWNGVTVEHLESLAAADAWHHEQGFVGAPRRIECFLWDEVDGLVQRIYCKGQAPAVVARQQAV